MKEIFYFHFDIKIIHRNIQSISLALNVKVTPGRFEGVVGVEMIMKGGVLTAGIFTFSLITDFISLLFPVQSVRSDQPCLSRVNPSII